MLCVWGSDSDLMVDLLTKIDIDHKIDYVWFDTGLEYQATKTHIKDLETKYGIEIKPYKAIVPIPISCKRFGQPFISKQVSEFISRLQRHNFQFEDESFDILYKRYPKCKAALRWWCNEWCDKNGGKSRFNISYNRWLKEFMIANPPTFKISNVCCKKAKKDVAHKCISDNSYDLDIIGVRKAEGGERSTIYSTCFSNKALCDEYRPLFWYTDKDKAEYKDYYKVQYSDCYEEYALRRTGCAGCPFGRNFEFELEVIGKYEPKLLKAVNNIFGDSYEYTRRYKEFAKEMNAKTKAEKRN